MSWIPVFPLWLILILLFLGGTAVIVQYGLMRRRLGSFRAIMISLLRLGVILLLLSFALNPSTLARKEHKMLSPIAILLDTSQSMGLATHSGKSSRLEDAKALLLDGEKPFLKSLTGRVEAKLYALGDSLRAFDGGELSRLKTSGKQVDLSEALDRLRREYSLAILLSDGNLKWEKKNSAGIPLITIPVGDTGEYRDTLIKEVKAPGLAFRGREVRIDVTIKSYGYPGLTLPVLLKDGNRLLTAKNMTIKQTSDEMTFPLSFIPEEVGQHHLSVSIPLQFGESLTSNNSVPFSLRVVRDKIRILMVSGNPSMSYRFMRMALKNDPSIDLLSFVILRTPSNILNVPIQEQSLIPFPVETLFSKELKNFDLLLFDNFAYQFYFNPKVLEPVREFVRGGGSFSMIGGPNVFDSYAGTPIEDILPVRLTGRRDYRRDSPLEIKLTPVGANHPITRLSLDENENVRLWQEMPPLDGVNLLEPKNSGMVLLESSQMTSWPILTVGDFGKGRVLVLSTDDSWKWYMGMVARGRAHWAYLRFIEKMVRWLTKDPSLDPVQIILPERAGTAGQETGIRITLKENDLSSNPKGTISLSVLNPDGLKIVSNLKTTGQSGEYVGSFFPEKEGMHKIKVETPFGSVEESWVITRPGEDLDGAPQHERLRMISASTGGKFLSRGDDLLKEIESYVGRDANRFIEERSLQIWSRPYVLAIILFLLTMEWYLRRRWGMV